MSVCSQGQMVGQWTVFRAIEKLEYCRPKRAIPKNGCALMRRTVGFGSGVRVQLSDLDGFTYGEGDFGYDTRVESVAWVINGKRTAARRSDVELLKAFLSGKLILKEGRFDEEVPLKRRLDRLRELLGGPRQ